MSRSCSRRGGGGKLGEGNSTSSREAAGWEGMEMRQQEGLPAVSPSGLSRRNQRQGGEMPGVREMGTISSPRPVWPPEVTGPIPLPVSRKAQTGPSRQRP